MPPRLARLGSFAPALLLVILGLELLVPALRQSVTVDEFAHLPSGLSYFEEGRFDLYSKNPPLVKALVALPVLAARPTWKPLAFGPGEGKGWAPWVVGTQFFYGNVERYDALFARARLVVIALTVLLAALLHRFCRVAFGAGPALVALALLVFCPNVLAHGSLATVDAGAALFAFLAVVAFRSWTRAPRLGRALLLGLALGFALLAKYSALVLVPSLAVVYAAIRIGGRKHDAAMPRRAPAVRRELGQLLLAAAAALLVVNAGLLFQGSFGRLGDLPLESGPGLFLQSIAPGWLAVPLPRDYVLGLDQQAADVERGEFLNYLRGEWSEKGWRSYYLYALLVKLTVPLLVILVLRVIARPRHDRDDLILLAPAAAYLLALSFGNHLQVGLRYLLPAFPLLFAWAGRFADSPFVRRRLGVAAVTALLAAHAIASASAFPRYLSYFNEIAGGPSNGYRHLLDSNLDWGQELPELRRWLAARGNPEVKLAYFGHVDPARYGIRFEIPEEAGAPHHGLYVVSANYLMGYPYTLVRDRRFVEAPKDRFSWLRDFGPTARVGHTFFVFEIP
jgi:hypothetical protein